MPRGLLFGIVTGMAIPNLTPDAPNVVAQAPQIKVGADAFNRAPQYVPQQSLAQGLEAIGSGLSDLAVPLAKKAAAEDVAANHDKNVTVTLNPDGTPQAYNPTTSFILGRAGEQYTAAVDAGTRSDLSSAVTQKLADIRAKNPTDIQAFTAAAGNYAEDLRTRFGGAEGNQLANQAHTEAAQHYGNMVEANARRDTAVSLQSITTSIDDTKNQLAAMARQGVNNTPEYAAAQAKLLSNYDQLGSNPLFGYGPDKIASEKQRATDDLRAQFVVGQVDQAYHRATGDSGRAGAQKVLEDQILNNPNIKLSDAERKQAYAWGMSRLSYLTDAQRADIAASKAASESVVAAYAKDPRSVPDVLYDAAVEKSRAAGDADSVAKLQSARMQSLMTAPTTGMTGEQRFNAAMGGAAPGGYIGALRQQENRSGSNTASPGTSSALGRYQFTSDTWSNVAARHPELKLTPDGRTDPQQQDRAIVAFTNDNKAALQKAGIAPTDANTYMAHFLGAGGATSFIRAMQADPNALAAGKNLAAATANPQVFYKPGADGKPDLSKPRTLQEVYSLQTQRFGGGTSPVASANGIPFTSDQLKQNPILMSAYAHSIASNAENTMTLGKSVGSALETQVKAGLMPDQTTLANYFQIAAQHPDTFGEQSQKIQTSIIANAGTTGAASPVAAQSFVDQTKALAESSPSIFHAQIAEAAQTALTRQETALKTDPWGEGTRRGWIERPPATLDFSSADALTHSMSEHGQAALRMAGHTGVAGTSAISPAEVPAIKSVMTSGMLDQRTTLLGAIASAGMPEPILKATLGALAGQKETLPLAVAGDLARKDPDAARAVLQGQAIMQAEPKFAPNKDDFPSELAKAIPFNDLPQTAAREGIAGAVQAYYAKLSADANDTTGVLNDDRMKTSIDKVTGGVVGYRGSNAIAPWYGAGQAGMDSAVRSLTDADFAGARTTSGEPFPSSALKPSLMGSLTWNNWRLQSAGDGKYLVFSGADDKRQYLGNAQGGKFILDLGAKRAQAQALDAGPLATMSNRTILYNSALMGGGN